MSRPTEHTQVMASSFSSESAPASTAAIMPASSDTGIKRPKGAHAGAGHDAALLDGIVEHGERAGRAGATAGAHADDLEDARDGVADGGRGSQRQVDNALFDTQATGGLAAHELAGTGDLKGGLLNLFGDFHHRCGIGQRLQGCSHNAGTRDAYVDDGVGLATSVDGTRHKRGVLDHVGKADKLGGANGILVCRKLGGIDDGLSRHEHGIHVDAGAQASDVDAGADAAGGGERLGDGLDDTAVGVADAFWTSAEKPPGNRCRASRPRGRGHAR